MFQFLLCLGLGFSPGAKADRQTPPQFSFAENENQSGLQKQDVELLFEILTMEFGTQIPNSSKLFSARFDWSKPDLGAGSMLVDGDFEVLLWGGFVRARGMTLRALAATLCHEIGHYLGGPPRQIFPGEGEHWSSAEGQADQFAATICLPRVYRAIQKHRPQELTENLDPISISLCQSSENRQQCQWVASSGIHFVSFLQIYYDFDQPEVSASVWAKETPTDTLLTQYPSDQCRMDIFKAGAQCLSEDNQCPQLRCWYRP